MNDTFYEVHEGADGQWYWRTRSVNRQSQWYWRTRSANGHSQWSWRTRSVDGQITSTGGEGYATASNARRSLHTMFGDDIIITTIKSAE